MLMYSVAVIWAFAVPGVALNTARDVGGRLWALSIWGTEGNTHNLSFSDWTTHMIVIAAGGRYAAIAALTNLIATIFAVVLYELLLVDSDKPLTPEAMMFGRLELGNRRLHPQEIPEIEASVIDKGRNSSTEKTSTV